MPVLIIFFTIINTCFEVIPLLIIRVDLMGFCSLNTQKLLTKYVFRQKFLGKGV